MRENRELKVRLDAAETRTRRLDGAETCIEDLRKQVWRSAVARAGLSPKPSAQVFLWEETHNRFVRTALDSVLKDRDAVCVRPCRLAASAAF